MPDKGKDNPNEISWDLSDDELESLKLVGLGCHRSCFEAIESVFHDNGLVSWTLSDYFLLKPVSREAARMNLSPTGPPAKDDEAKWKSKPPSPESKQTVEYDGRPQLYYPFLERRMRKQPFLADVDPEPGFVDEAARRAHENKQANFYGGLLERCQAAKGMDPTPQNWRARAEAVNHVLAWQICPNDRRFLNDLRRDFPDFVSHLLDETNGMWLIRNWLSQDPVGWVTPETREGDRRKQAVRRHSPYTLWGVVEGLIGELKPCPDDIWSDLSDTTRLHVRNNRAAARVEHAVNDHFWLLKSRRVETAQASTQDPATLAKIAEADKKFVETEVTELIAVSIASKDHFYGYLIVEFPPQEEKEVGKTLKSEVEKVLSRSASGNYLDVLVLFFNRVFESRLKKRLDECSQKSRDDAARILDDFFAKLPFDPLPDDVSTPLTQVEDWIRWLWARRRGWWDNFKVGHRAALRGDAAAHKADSAEFEPLRQSLVLAKMQIASPPMVTRIRQLMNFHIDYDPEASQLPSVLVIGGPGSGKDATARLVAIFAKGYTFGEIHTINMAAMRPQTLVGPMLQGAHLGALQCDPIFPVVKKGEEQQAAVTVILDELNSLDIDQQGILLRILENREVTPMFTRDTRRANFLCVGVMNEKPEDLMKEDALAPSSARTQLFGDILGTIVDEMFRGARRLRPDLFYRMQRFGIIHLPDLQKRRADIPILFRSFLPARDPFGNKIKYDIELDTYERLMEKDLPWPGNIRELQAVAKRVYQLVEVGADRSGKEFVIKIRRRDLNRALNQSGSGAVDSEKEATDPLD